MTPSLGIENIIKKFLEIVVTKQTIPYLYFYIATFL